MSKNNLEDMVHIVRKINFFLGMCCKDIEHLNYMDEEKELLKFAISTQGSLFCHTLMEMVVVADNVSKLREKQEVWEPSEKAIAKVSNAYDKEFGNVGEKKPETKDILPEGQTSKEALPPPGHDIPSGEEDPFGPFGEAD